MNQTTHTIEIQITPDGKIVGEIHGVAGPHCAPLSAWLEELGLLEHDSPTADYRRQPVQTVRIPTAR
jgi:hypothetical protein